MHVVYSAGSTPTPSPHLQRKTGYGRPIMPGYMTHVQPQVYVHRSREKLTEGDVTLRDSIPAMSKGVAILCLILNIILPGSGTLTAGLSVLCCSTVRPKGDTKAHCILLNAGVALLQFMLTFLCLLGWIWSIVWGVAFLAVSKRYNKKSRAKDASKKQGEAYPRGSDSHGFSRSTSSLNDVIHTDNNRNNDIAHGRNTRGNDDKKNCSNCHHHHEPHKRHQGKDFQTDQHQQQNNKRHDVSRHERFQDREFCPYREAREVDEELHQQQNELSDINASKDPEPMAKETSFPEALQLSPPPSSLPPEASASSSSATSHTNTCRDSANTSSDRKNKPSGSQSDVLPKQPIFVLQRTPGTSHEACAEHESPSGPGEAILKARTRHMKILQRKMSDNDLSPFVLTNQQLEAIIIHDFPINAPLSGETVPEEAEGHVLSKV